MPFDGFVTKCISEELNIILAGGRIEKIQQPERDEIHLVIRNNGQNHRLLISSNAASPRIHLTTGAKENPEKAPMFCMILRKHIGGGRILGISAPDFERAVGIRLESTNELGDVAQKTLMVEIMGRHSNIILINEDGRIIDSLVHVDQDMSSVREVMPARPYSPPPPQDKMIPGRVACAEIVRRIASARDELPAKKINAALLDVIMGASPLFCRELCHRAGVGDSTPLALASEVDLEALGGVLASIMDDVANEKYSPCVVLRESPLLAGDKRVFYDNGDGRDMLDFYCWIVGSTGAEVRRHGTMSSAIDEFYEGRARAASLAQRKAWLIKLVAGNIARCQKKLAIQQESMREAAGYNDLKLYGELITANIHNIGPGNNSVSLLNYYLDSGDEYVDVKLDGDISPQANAQNYFRRYRKAASTLKHAEIQAAESARELAYLESVLHELDMSQNSREIDEIRQELSSQRYVSGQAAGKGGRGGRGKSGGAKGGGGNQGRKGGGKKGGREQAGYAGFSPNAGAGRNESQSAPYTFVSSDGLTIFVGKNNRQNDMLTMRTASSNDIWLHARGIPGAHVLIKKQQGEVPHGTLLEAANLAAYYSKSRMSENVGVDYTAAKHVRKPSGAKPGMVIYDNQRTMFVTPDATLLSHLINNT